MLALRHLSSANRLAFRQWVSTSVSAFRPNINKCKRVRLARELRFGDMSEVRMPIQRSILESSVTVVGYELQGYRQQAHALAKVEEKIR